MEALALSAPGAMRETSVRPYMRVTRVPVRGRSVCRKNSRTSPRFGGLYKLEEGFESCTKARRISCFSERFGSRVVFQRHEQCKRSRRRRGKDLLSKSEGGCD